MHFLYYYFLIAAVSLFMQGLNFGIDFQGGTLLQLKFEKKAELLVRKFVMY